MAGDPTEWESSLRRSWHPVGWASTLGQGPGATTLLGERIVLWRDVSGQPAAAIDRCPHRGTALSLGEVDDAGCLVCPYHGWRYAADGACVNIPQLRAELPIPSPARLSMLACIERYGLAWVSLDEPRGALPSFAEWDDPDYRHVACPPYRWRTSPERMLENFTDFGHLGYLHDGLLGSRDDLVVPAHQIEQRGLELHYELTMEVPNTNDAFAVTDVVGRRGLQTNTYVLSLPYTIHLACRYHDTGAHRTLLFSVQPHGDGTCTGYCYQSRDFDLGGADEPYAAFQELLAEQDRPIVESQEPAEVPLQPRSELHLPFDRVAIAYRRAMSELRDPGSQLESEGAPGAGDSEAPGEAAGGVRTRLTSTTLLEREVAR